MQKWQQCSYRPLVELENLLDRSAEQRRKLSTGQSRGARRPHRPCAANFACLPQQPPQPSTSSVAHDSSLLPVARSMPSIHISIIDPSFIAEQPLNSTIRRATIPHTTCSRLSSCCRAWSPSLSLPSRLPRVPCVRLLLTSPQHGLVDCESYWLASSLRSIPLSGAIGSCMCLSRLPF
jgi:hypothetical protein